MTWKKFPWFGTSGSRHIDPQPKPKLDEVRVPARKSAPQRDATGAPRKPPTATAVVGDRLDSVQAGSALPAREGRETLLCRLSGDAACADRLIDYARTRCAGDPVGTAVWQLYRDRRSWK
jgi:hypothetical protein